MTGDRKLLAAVKSGDRKAFEAIFRKYAPKLYSFLVSYFNNKSDAEEILQETFLKVWETRKSIDENSNFSNYIFSIARHKMYNVFKHRVVERKYGALVMRHAEGAYQIESEILANDLREYLLSGIGQLSPQQKEVVLLKNDGYENEEIARMMGISKRTVETHVYRSFKFLRVYLSKSKDILSTLLVAALFFF